MEKNRIIDGFASLINEATSTAKGLGKEAQNVINAQVEKTLSRLDVVKREDFEILKVMVSTLSYENKGLKNRIIALEEKVGITNEKENVDKEVSEIEFHKEN